MASALAPIFSTKSTSVSVPSSLSTSTRINQKNPKVRVFTKPKLNPISALSDPYVLQIAETLEDSLPSLSSPTLQKLRETSSENLLSTPWPSRKDEPFRFTDTSFLKNSRIEPILPPKFQASSLDVFSDTLLPTISILDGYIMNDLSRLTELTSGVYVGSLLSVKSEAILKRVSEYESGFNGDLFWSLNGVGAPDVLLVYVAEGCKVENPLLLRYISGESSDKGLKALPFSNPRVLVLVEKGGEISIVEEYVGGDKDKCYWSNSVIEVVVGEGAKVSHSYLQNQSLNAAHIKWTWVQQESTSTYEHIEVSTGGKLSRHNIHIQQVGPDTVTELSTFHMCISDQTQDLHSTLVLDHPRGVSQQIHKCIVAHSSGQAVFDGNVQVNRYAQQTDAGQLTRSLLLEPRATVNVKPNLQIIADDVKCSHGAAISDLEEDQLFYFRARGVDIETARKALIFSFAAEVVDRFPNASIRKKVETHIRELLDPSRP
ncbi:PREDICTED: protein ABCI7, chloroplastic [Nicotiana attenuata]|uniref:Protein abci7, chloroplastic n=1 Tax=Nicotiana attenuata TaxID=49451 RepID=A0A314L7Y0_NICAT|nr:PREDICTED: protein ABCI7, chloroplastic [Nicotiana attenuata]OIT37645.1 protein abci7, chloroplastic [Nicotiana attenuata]